MFRRPTLILLSVAAMAAGVLSTSTAALADPPWARGERGYRHGGPPPWAPAHGYRRHHEFGGYDRPYRGSRFSERRRFDGDRGYRY